MSLSLRDRFTALPRWLRAALLTWCAWLAVSTLLLNQPLIDDWINRKPLRGHVSWSFAVSVVPGHLQAWGVTFRGHARKQAFAITARRASVWFVPWALARKEIRLTRLRAHGMAVALRDGVVELAPPEPREHPWTFVLSGAEAREVWSLQFLPDWHLTGRARASLDLSKVLTGGAVEIPGGTVDWESLAIDRGTHRWLSGGRLTGRMQMASLVPAQSTTLEKWAAIRAELRLDGAVPALQLVDGGLAADGDAPDAGQLLAHIGLEAGRLTPYTRIGLSQPVRVTTDALDVDHKLTAGLAILGERMQLVVDLPPAASAATTLSAKLSLPRLDLRELGNADGRPGLNRLATRLARDATGSVNASLRFRSLSLLRPVLGRWKGLDADGEGWIHAALAIDQGRVLPEETRLRFDDVVLRLSALGHALEAKIDGSPTRIEGPRPGHRIALQSVVVNGPDGELLLSDANAQLDVTALQEGTSLIEAPALAFLMQDAAIPDLRAFNRYLPPGTVAFEKGDAALTLGLSLEEGRPLAQGHVRLTSPGATLTIADMRVQGQVEIQSTLRDANLETQELQLLGTRVDLHQVRFDVPGGEPVANWTMAMLVDEAQGRIDAPMAFDGLARIAMSDLRLVLAVYAHMTDYPKWMLRLVDSGQVEARGRFAFRDGELKLDDVVAENDRFKLQARLRFAEATRRGALLAQWGPLTLGVDLRDGGSEMKLLKAREWFERSEP